MNNDNDIKYQVESFNEESNYIGKTKLPKPPKPGEYMYCQLCGNPILPSELSKDEKKRKRELKWHIHDKCYNAIDYKLDMMTPGLMSSRYGNKNSLHKILKEKKEDAQDNNR